MRSLNSLILCMFVQIKTCVRQIIFYLRKGMSFSVKDFLFDTPLYSPVKVTDEEIRLPDFFSLFFNISDFTIEGYNVLKKTESTFIISRNLMYSGLSYEDGGYGEVQLECKRYHDILRFHILWNSEQMYIVKIGQYPSVADFHIGEIKDYNRVISQDKLREFTKSIGLAAHGVGIGSFVYLRRVV
jgi:hypothetical protein